MPKRILVIEDDRLSREAMTNVLKHKGHKVFAARSSEDAWNVVAEASPLDVVLVDIGLPGLAGDSFASTMHLRQPKTQIIFVSGQYSMMDPERFGPDTRFFTKPIDPAKLLDAIGN